MLTYTTTDGRQIQAVSRWITINHATVTERHSLAQYAEEDGSLWFFRWRGRLYALGQFFRYGSPWGLSHPPIWEEADGLHHMSGIDLEDYWQPIQIELSDGCEAVRVWREVTV